MDETLFNDYQRLILFPQLDDSFESFERVLDSGMYISRLVHQHFKQENVTEQRNDGLILFQMVFTKGIAIKHLCSGMEYYNEIGGFSVVPLHDPMSIANLVRSQFEAFSNFHNIFISPESNDIQNFLYDAWVISGLRNRQNYVDEGASKLLKEKSLKEKELIDALTAQIKSNLFYLSLSHKKKKWVDERIEKNKVFEFRIKSGEIDTPGWRQLFLNAGCKEMFQHQYSFLSLLTHPSNASVFQFDSIHRDNRTFEMCISLMNRSKEIMAFLIHDYCNYIPGAIQYFNSLPPINKVIIDSINTHFRDGTSPLDENREQFFEDLEAVLKEFLQKDQL